MNAITINNSSINGSYVADSGEDEIFNKPEAANFIKSSTRTVDTYMRQGMPFSKLPSGTVRFRRKQLIEWLDQYQHGALN